jgi:hypothetical protein
MMEYLNHAAFEENSDLQESWLTPLPGATKYISFLDSQTQGLQVVTRSTVPALEAFPLIIPLRNVADGRQNVPSRHSQLEKGLIPSKLCLPRRCGLSQYSLLHVACSKIAIVLYIMK